MVRKLFTQELQEVKNEILLLGSMVEQAVMEAASALKDNDLERSRRVLANNRQINPKRYEIELAIIILIATQQPTAHDLRMLTGIMDICVELKRIGDYAKGIATINLRSGGLGMPKILRDIYAMAEKAVDMLHSSLTAFAEEDIAAAQMLIAEDDVIDECYTHLYHEAVNYVLENGSNMERSNYIIWAAHNLERLGDRATNICERVVYIGTGERPVSSMVTGKLWLPTPES